MKNKDAQRVKESGHLEQKLQAPNNYEDMIDEISAHYDQLSKRLKQIAKYAIDYPNDIAINTIAETAKKADVQPSALIRFAQAFNFDGFSDMQRVFQQNLLNMKNNNSEHLDSLSLNKEDSPLNLLNQFAKSHISALDHMRQNIQTEKLEKAIHLLKNAEVINIMAMRGAFPLAAYFFYSVTNLNIRSHLIDNMAGLGQEQQNQIRSNDALFVASFSPYSSEVIQAATYSSQQNVPVIALTDHPLSPLTNISSVSFCIKEDTTNDVRSLAASMCLIQTLVTGLKHE